MTKKKDKDIDQLVDVDYNNQYLKTSSGCVCRIQIDRRFFCTQRDIDQKRYGYWPKKTRILNNSLMLITTIRVWKLISCIQLLVVCAALKLTEDFFAQKGILTKKDKDIDQLIDVYFNNQYLKTNFMHLSSGCLCRIDINFACRRFFLQTQEVIMMSFRFWLAAWFMWKGDIFQQNICFSENRDINEPFDLTVIALNVS